MAKVISGYAGGGGSLNRRGSLVERAAEDLEAKLNGAKVQAIAAYPDDAGLHLIAVCEGDSIEKPSASINKKKGGR